MSNLVSVSLMLPKNLVLAIDNRVFELRRDETTLKASSRTSVILDLLSSSPALQSSEPILQLGAKSCEGANTAVVRKRERPVR